MEDMLNKLTETYNGWTLVSFTTDPTAGPGAEQNVIITLRSPDDGTEAPSIEKTVRIANVLTGDISEG